MSKKLILIITIIIVSILIFSLCVDDNQNKPKDIARVHTEMMTEVCQTNEGYKIKIIDLGDYNNLSIFSNKIWTIWDSNNKVEIESGILSINKTDVWLIDNNSNSVIDIGDEIRIQNIEHEFGGYYFILYNTPDKRFYIIHEILP